MNEHVVSKLKRTSILRGCSSFACIVIAKMASAYPPTVTDVSVRSDILPSVNAGSASLMGAAAAAADTAAQQQGGTSNLAPTPNVPLLMPGPPSSEEGLMRSLRQEMDELRASTQMQAEQLARIQTLLSASEEAKATLQQRLLQQQQSATPSSSFSSLAATATAASPSSVDWSGFEQYLIPGLARPLLLAKGTQGYAACGYIDVATADKLEEACVIFTGVTTCDDFFTSDVKKVSAKAEVLGCFVGQSGSAAMEMLR